MPDRVFKIQDLVYSPMTQTSQHLVTPLANIEIAANSDLEELRNWLIANKKLKKLSMVNFQILFQLLAFHTEEAWDRHPCLH